MNARPVRNRQLGGGTLKFLVTMAILGFAAFSAYEVIPAYFANYQLQDMMKSEALFATSAIPRKTPDDIHDDIWKKIQELGIPARQEDIKVTAATNNQAVTVAVDYTVPVNLIVYQFTLEFHPHADSHSI